MSAVLTQMVRAKVAPLIRLLSSPVEGERLAAVGGIGRVLRSAGLSFHELASAIERPLEPAAQRSQAPKPKPRRPARAGASRGAALSPARRQTLIVALRLLLRDARSVLTAWETEFTEAILRTLESERPSLSDKQLEILEKILHRERRWPS